MGCVIAHYGMEPLRVSEEPGFVADWDEGSQNGDL
jgi:hypothetical protein